MHISATPDANEPIISPCRAHREEGKDYALVFGTAHKVISLDQTVGAAALMAEFNGLDKYPHIQEKLAWLAMHCQINDTMARAACEHPDMYEDIGLAAPNLMYTNIAKFMFANGQHEASKLLADITGGVTTTVFGYKDWMNLEERPFNNKYLAGKGGIPTEHRLRAIRLVKDLIGDSHDATIIHAEGSLGAKDGSLRFC